MELSEASVQTPAQTASQAWRYVVAQATGTLMARFRINSGAAHARLTDRRPRPATPRRCGTRDRRRGQQVGVGADRAIGATAASMRSQQL